MTSRCRTCGLTFETTDEVDSHLVDTLARSLEEGRRPADSHVVQTSIGMRGDVETRQVRYKPDSWMHRTP